MKPSAFERAIKRGDRRANEPAPICTLCAEEIDACDEVDFTSEGWPFHANAADCSFPDDDDSRMECDRDLAAEAD